MNFNTFARGKLLITGEYAVLDGALAFALPVRYGQRMEVFELPKEKGLLRWQSYDADGTLWFFSEFDPHNFEILETTDAQVAGTLAEMLQSCRRQIATFLTEHKHWQVKIHADFPRHWGLGSSSTLIAALGKWSGADPYQILADTLGGSGYDIACAYAPGPVLYGKKDSGAIVQNIKFNPEFIENIYFIYLGKKQNSREGMARYRERGGQNAGLVEVLTGFTHRAVAATTLDEFAAVLQEHEAVLAPVLGMQPVQQQYFTDYWGVVKSLGAWGGDFVLATSHKSEAETRLYFNERGFQVFIPYSQMI